MSTATDLLAPLLSRLGYDVHTWGVCPAIDADMRGLAIAILDYERDERLTPPERACLIEALRAACDRESKVRNDLKRRAARAARAAQRPPVAAAPRGGGADYARAAREALAAVTTRAA